MERIPRTALAGALALGLALGLGPADQSAQGAVKPRARAVQAAVADTFLKPVSSTLALRAGSAVDLVLSPPTSPSAPVRLVVRSPAMTSTDRVSIAVDGSRVSTFVPLNGRFYGATGAIDRDRLVGGPHRVVLTIARRKASALTVTRAFSVPVPVPVPVPAPAPIPAPEPVPAPAPVPAPEASPTPAPVPAPEPVPAPPPIASHQILWGALVDGDAYGPGRYDPPWDMTSLATFEAHAGKAASIVHYGQFWRSGGVPQPFYAGDHQRVRDHGAIPMLDWNPWDSSAGGSATQPDFALARIIAGNHDAYIRSWATGARNWGHPLFLRFAHEMNGDWYPWSERRNGNTAGQYAAAWHHVHDIFTSVGATNVTWVWSPNVVYPGSIDLASLYPGDAYVDWVAADGYNWGTNAIQPDAWKTFSQVFTPTYDALGALAPGKPMMLAELGATESGGSKGAWIADALTTIPTSFPRIRAVVWFNWNDGGWDWSIETSASAQAAFAAGISDARYAGGGYAGLTATGPITAP